MAGNLIISYLSLTRPLNLIIIIATMLGVWFYSISENPTLSLPFLDFILLILATSLIAASGNIINDYYDIHADAINKPTKQILSKSVSKKMGFKIYLSFNSFAMLIGFYLSLKYQTFWFITLNTFCIFALWFYSYNLKKSLLLGNILIALLTGLIPLAALSYFAFDPKFGIYALQDTSNWFTSDGFNFVFYLASFAILQNLAREICKDINDVDGDQLIGVVSIPMSYGLGTTKSVISFILILEIVCFIFVFKQLYSELNFVRLTILSAAIGVNLIILFFLSKKRDMIKSCEGLLKLSMFIGLSALYL